MPRHSTSTHQPRQLQTKAPLDHETKDSYTVTVTATDPSDYSDDITVTITITDVKEPPSVLAAPAVGAASTSGHNRLSVSWQAPDDVGIPPITGYDVEYRKKDAMEDWGTVNVTVSGVGATITGLTSAIHATRCRCGRRTTRARANGRLRERAGPEQPPPKTEAEAEAVVGAAAAVAVATARRSLARPPPPATVAENTGAGEDYRCPGRRHRSRK